MKEKKIAMGKALNMMTKLSNFYGNYFWNKIETLVTKCENIFRVKRPIAIGTIIGTFSVNYVGILLKNFQPNHSISIMDIIIQSLGFTASENLETFIKEKLQSLNNENIVRANVTLFLGSETNVENNVCEIKLEVPGNNHFVKKASTAFEIAVTECGDVLVSMINKEKSKIIARRQADVETIQDIHLQAEDEANAWVDLEDVVKPS